MISLGGRVLNSLFSFQKLALEPSLYNGTVIQNRNYALRVGTRARKLKQKLKNIALKRSREAKKPKQKPLAKDMPDFIKFPLADNRVSPDNVWLHKYYSWKTYSFAEAVQCHREYFHPTVYNMPDAKLKAIIELNMKTANEKKPLGAFNSLVAVPHKFSIEEHRTIMAIAETPEQQAECRNAGAHFVGGAEIVRLIKIGEMSTSDFNHIVAPPQMLSQLLVIKGILKEKFPTLKKGTLGADLNSIIYKLLHGIKFTFSPSLHFPEYASTEIPFGTIDMTTPQLEENFKSILENIQTFKPKTPQPFFLRIRMRCPPSRECFKLDIDEFIKQEIVEDDGYDDDDDEDNDTVSRAEI